MDMWIPRSLSLIIKPVAENTKMYLSGFPIYSVAHSKLRKKKALESEKGWSQYECFEDYLLLEHFSYNRLRYRASVPWFETQLTTY